jgi:hypothetical protein
MVEKRFCNQCGKEHNTCIEDRIVGTFEPIDTCIDCLMSKYSFKFEQKQITLEDTESLTYEDMHVELGKTIIGILQGNLGIGS